jgi:SAM-dependent methyltransferase
LRAGQIASLRPLSDHFGLDRGTPVDRFYIENFLGGHSADIRGTVVEVVNATYSRRFGGERITQQHVVDTDGDNSQATIVGDLATPGVLPTATFDCIILTQTLHLIYDLQGAVQQLRRALRQGGVLLVTTPGITPARPADDYRWYWSLTPDSLRQLLSEEFGPSNVEITSFGNLFAATAFLHGAALEEVDIARLVPTDPAFPVIVAARAVA